MIKKNGQDSIIISRSGNLTETDIKIAEHRRKKWENRGIFIGIVVAAIFLLRLIFALGSYEDYSIRTHADRGASMASKFTDFKDNIIEYSNDGIVYMKNDGTLIWNQAFEMISPAVDVCGDYLLVYDKGGTSIYILTENGVQQSFEMGRTIRKVCIASQGTIAVLMKTNGDAYINLYDISGKELAAGELYAKESKLVMDIALSTDGNKMAVDSINISEGKLNSEITFYNFGAVGQGEIDNIVGNYLYEDTVFPEIDFVSDKTLLAISDHGFQVFEGTQKPEPTKNLQMDREVESVFHNDKYVGIIYPSDDEENTRQIRVYDLNGNSVMENKTTVSYDQAYFLRNNEICILGSYACEIYTIRSIKKFSYTWDSEVYKILDNGVLNDYLLIRNGGTEQIRLK